MKKSPLVGIHRGEVSNHPGHVFVRSGDVALTRALLERGAIRVLSKRGKRTQQIGVAALPEWIEAARAEVASTAGERAVARARGRVARAAKEVEYREEFARAVRRLYPAIPAGDLAAVVERACEVSSGRVGRSAAAKALADEPVRLAVLAHIRHVHTDYDRQLRRAGLGQRFGRASREDRQKARKSVKKTIAAKAAEWSRAEAAAAGTETVAATVAETGTGTGADTELAAGTGTKTEPATDRSRPKPLGLFAPALVEALPATANPPRDRPAPRRETRPRFEQQSLWQRPLG